MEKLREKIKQIILKEVESDSPQYHGIDEYSVNDAVNLIMVEIQNSTKLIETKEEIFKKGLLELQNSKENYAYFSYPEDISIDKIQDLLSNASGTSFQIESFNGCDQDWSETLIIDGTTYNVWGSATSGSLSITYIKIK